MISTYSINLVFFEISLEVAAVWKIYSSVSALDIIYEHALEDRTVTPFFLGNTIDLTTFPGPCYLAVSLLVEFDTISMELVSFPLSVVVVSVGDLVSSLS